MQEKKRSRLPDLILFAVILTLLGIGIVMVFSSSSVTASKEMGDAYYYLKRQSIYAAIGLVAMFIAMNINYRFWKKFWFLILLGVIVLLALTLIPGVGIVVGGSRRWLGFGAFRIQPSEFSKIALIIAISAYLSAIGDKVKKFAAGVLVPLLVTGVICVLVLLEPDFGTAIVILGMVVAMLFMAGCNGWHLAGIGGLAVPAAAYIMISEPYRLKRITAFLNPWQDPLGDGFHIIQSLFALGSGGFFGVGLGMSRQKFYYLPEQYTDFIFAIIGEELGFLGAIGVVLLYGLLAWRGFRTAINCKDKFGSILASGITSMLVIQAIINLCVVSGLLPVTGITLPLISSGGSSLIPMLFSLGILLNISKQSNEERQEG